jgi:hypothetical protein
MALFAVPRSIEKIKSIVVRHSVPDLQARKTAAFGSLLPRHRLAMTGT